MHRGYYRFPAVHGDKVIFTSEGDLWTVPLHGGDAQRITTDSGTETMAKLSPDGKTVAFAAQYEGPTEVYTMPVVGGLPERRTWDGDALPEGWTPDGRLLIQTHRYSTLPDPKLVTVSMDGTRQIVPLASAAQGSYAADGHTLFFTRWNKQFSNTKRYKGGWNESLWRFNGTGEATPLTADYPGTSRNPMVADGHVYFLSDRDGVMNVWSMDEDGHKLHEETHEKRFDIESASVSDGHLVYACAGDLHLLDLKSGQDTVIAVNLLSDFDQLRERWVEHPAKYLTDVHVAPDGSAAVFTARGEVFTLPVHSGRIVRIAGEDDVRYRDARYLPDGKSIVALSTKSGETEFWKFPANGIGAPEQWTHDAKVLRWDGVPSPDGKYLAHRDKDQQLWIYNIATHENKRIEQSMTGDIDGLSWSPDSRWLAFEESATNQFTQIKLLNIQSGAVQAITSDRYNSMSAAWSTDGKWLYFLSDRNLQSVVDSPWGPRKPEPYFDHAVKLYQLALVPDQRSPFLAPDELHPADGDKDKDKKKDDDKPKNSAGDKATPDKAAADKGAADKGKDDAAKKDDKAPAEVKVDFTNLESRLEALPAPAGNYSDLQAADKRLCWLSHGEGHDDNSLQCLDIANKGDAPDTVSGGVDSYEITLDRKKMLIHKGDGFYVVGSDAKAATMGDAKGLAQQTIDLSHWQFSTNPRAEFRGLFLDAWRLERDYFYDRHMQGVNWIAMRDDYMPLVDRVADRDELNDVIAQMVSELSALHTFVGGGDDRKASQHIDLATLGAVLERDPSAGGDRVKHIYAYDQDLPDTAPPLARPDSLVHEGEVITTIDGQSVLSAPDERVLLRGKAGTQVMLQVKSTTGAMRDVLVTPISADNDEDMRYAEWEYTRRTEVDKASDNSIGYVHLRAMGAEDIDQWARDYYPVFKRQGLIIDVRHNEGGNIDSWLLSTLLRKAWFYWQPRVGEPDWNMQYAFRGHIVVLCDQETASDGEAFTAGFEHFDLGKVIGLRTWGGEIWLSGRNRQEDGGVATAAEIGTYTPDGKWLIEGHGVDPDIVVDDLPHATFDGDDAQLDAAIALLKKEIAADPRPVPPAPPYPDKSFHYSHD